MMRKYWYIALLMCLVATPALAFEHYSNDARDQNGRAISGATITVYHVGTTTLATIYSDNGVNVKANPFTTALDGVYDFYAADGRYDIRITKTGYTSVYWDPAKTAGLTLFDANEFIVPYGASFPAPYRTGQIFIMTADDGACQGGGALTTLCRWDGALWVPIGGGGGGGVTGWPTVNVANGITFANALATAARFGNGTDYWVLYRDATDGLQFTCVVSGVLNDCNYVRKLASGKYTEWQNSAGTSIGRLTESTGAWTNFVLNTESTGNTLTIQEETWWDVAACQNTTASLVWDVPTTNAPAATCDTGSNTQKGYAAFDDTTDESFEMHWVLPTGFTGAIDLGFIWKAAATFGAVGWCAQLIRVADGSTSDPAYPAQASGNCVSDTAKGTTLQENRANITGVTCTSCAAGDHVYVRISRDANGGAVTDSMTGDAFLMKVGRTWRVAK